ncbi:MAG: hypothetical protein HGB26_06015, partial [Desulfobulbaceae bacterium]|nr:hypothetical protein [Desulfobulbaceae bacterium]
MSIFNVLSIPWVGSVIGIIGIIAAMFFYRRSIKITQLAFQYDTVTIIGNSNAAFPSEVDILFSGKSVPRVTLERFVIWNSGNTTINSVDISTLQPVCIRLSNKAYFLKSRILRNSRNVNNASICHSSNNQQIDLMFDFFDPTDGITIEVLHSGDSKNIELVGVIKGMPKGIKNFGKARWFGNQKPDNITISYLMIF